MLHKKKLLRFFSNYCLHTLIGKNEENPVLLIVLFEHIYDTLSYKKATRLWTMGNFEKLSSSGIAFKNISQEPLR
jgi:hypothetical protein